MAITTKANVKTYLQITDTTRDALIEMLIPKVEEDFLNIRNAAFDTEVVGENVGVGNGTTKVFTLAKKPIINDSEMIYIAGIEQVQDNQYTINNTTGVITFVTAPEDSDRITADYESQAFYYPNGAELTAIMMVAYLMNKNKSSGVNSESLGDHSISYSDSDMIAGYPKSIVGNIKRFVVFK